MGEGRPPVSAGVHPAGDGGCYRLCVRLPAVQGAHNRGHRRPGLRPSAILELCGYQEGDNLALLTTGEQEAALRNSSLMWRTPRSCATSPAARRSTLRRPQAALRAERQPVVYHQWKGQDPGGGHPAVGGGYADHRADPERPGGGQHAAGGGTPLSSRPWETILSTLVDLGGVGEFTALDLTGSVQHHPELPGQGCCFSWGIMVDLEYKLTYGYGLVTSTDPVHIAQDEYGTLDLTLAGDVKKAYFTESAGSSVSSAAGEDGSSGAAGDAAGGTSSEESSSSAADGAEGETGGEEALPPRKAGGAAIFPARFSPVDFAKKHRFFQRGLPLSCEISHGAGFGRRKFLF